MLYDEPTTGLDPIRSEVINQLILKLSISLGITSIVVTHDLMSAYRIADRIVLLHEGQVALEGTPREFETTDNQTARQFLRGELGADELARIRGSGDDAATQRGPQTP